MFTEIDSALTDPLIGQPEEKQKLTDVANAKRRDGTKKVRGSNNCIVVAKL